MTFGLVLTVHVLVCLFLIIVILIQGGRGGLGETMGGAAAQSLFGGAANVVMTKVTTVVAALFGLTCIVLVMLSNRQGRSVIEQLQQTSPAELPAGLPLPVEPSAPAEPVAPPPSEAGQ